MGPTYHVLDHLLHAADIIKRDVYRTWVHDVGSKHLRVSQGARQLLVTWASNLDWRVPARTRSDSTCDQDAATSLSSAALPACQSDE